MADDRLPPARRRPSAASCLAVSALVLLIPRDVTAQPPATGGGAPVQPSAGVTVAAIASSLATDAARLDPAVGGDGPGRLGLGLQAAAHLWLRGVVLGIEASTAALKWTDSRPRSLGPETQFAFRENVGFGVIGVGWPRTAPALVGKAGVGLRGGAVNRGDDAVFGEDQQRNRVVWAAGLDILLGRSRPIRPVLTARYVHAIRSDRERSAGVGARTLRLGLGLDFGSRE